MSTSKNRAAGGGAGRAALVLLALSAAGIVAGASGCAGPLERRAWRPGASGGAEPIEGAGGSWDLVMASPGTAAWAAESGGDASAWPEYARNDARLGYRQDGPILATAEWPERERPDLFYPRRVTIGTRADEITLFDYESRYYRYGRWDGGYRGGTGTYGSGTYGFWR